MREKGETAGTRTSSNKLNIWKERRGEKKKATALKKGEQKTKTRKYYKDEVMAKGIASARIKKNSLNQILTRHQYNALGYLAAGLGKLDWSHGFYIGEEEGSSLCA
ncbi:hypothetical protein TNCT_185461 [Trichonephila clavata]|uniref:Uncharacterized protein n=1 Tax=Trichonephila clavata TaxID=2740835 RepID=A0A8X6HLH7_TRICU|nr:hypothetical protein TNCT_185461 [Trichonephila clavata]